MDLTETPIEFGLFVTMLAGPTVCLPCMQVDALLLSKLMMLLVANYTSKISFSLQLFFLQVENN